ncbi:MAG: lysophospholipid acyltransferase family protein [Saprospiraceae bacterium]
MNTLAAREGLQPEASSYFSCSAISYLCARMGIFRKIWAVYAVLLFLALLFLAGFPVLLLNMTLAPGERALRRNIFFLHHIFTPVFLMLVGIRVRVDGADKLDKTQSYLIVGNHSSALDFIANAEAFPGVFRFLAKQELHRVPVFGWVVKKMCLTVDRTSAMSRARSVVLLKQQLAAGWSIFIYPEGGRNRTAEPLAPFYDGAFRIAIQTQAPIAVQTIVNMKQISATAKSIDLRPGTVYIVWDGPIQTTGMTAADIPALKEQVRQLMLNRLNKLNSQRAV